MSTPPTTTEQRSTSRFFQVSFPEREGPALPGPSILPTITAESERGPWDSTPPPTTSREHREPLGWGLKGDRPMDEQHRKPTRVREESARVAVLANHATHLEGTCATDEPGPRGFVLLTLPQGVYRLTVQRLGGGQHGGEVLDLGIAW